MKKKGAVVRVIATVLFTTGILGLPFAKANESGVRSGTIQVGVHMKSEFPGLAKIDFVQAVREVLKKIKGNLLRVEIEKENGFLIYGVEIVTPENSIVAVKVDAGSGVILTMEENHANHERGGRDEDRENRKREDAD